MVSQFMQEKIGPGNRIALTKRALDFADTNRDSKVWQTSVKMSVKLHFPQERECYLTYQSSL